MRLILFLLATLCAVCAVAAQHDRQHVNRRPARRGRRCRPHHHSSWTTPSSAASASSSPSPSAGWSKSSRPAHNSSPASRTTSRHPHSRSRSQSSQSPFISASSTGGLHIASSSASWGASRSTARPWGSKSSWGAKPSLGAKSSSAAAKSSSVSWGSGSDSGSGSSGSSGNTGSSGSAVVAVYGDSWQSNGIPSTPPKGLTLYLLAFWTSTSGPVDAAMAWTQASAEQRKQIKQTYARAGVKIMVSAFGSTDYPILEGKDATQTANALAHFVKQYDLDGVDVDFEDSASFLDGKAVAWLVTLQKTLRKQLPSGQYVITHAPQAPYFSSQCQWGAGYSKIYQQVGDGIDHMLVQYYNQGAGMYESCNQLLHSSSGTCPGSSVFEISKNENIPLSKLVIGKPATTSDASSGYMDPHSLGKCYASARSQGWNAGMVFWQYPHLTTSMIRTAKQAAGW